LGQFSGSACQSVVQPQTPCPSGLGAQVQSQQVTPEDTQQPEAYQVVLMTQGLAQTPAAVQCSQ
jgi:hypothetical protein